MRAGTGPGGLFISMSLISISSLTMARLAGVIDGGDGAAAVLVAEGIWVASRGLFALNLPL